jgi:uncharacterized iron-regulated membrane protein
MMVADIVAVPRGSRTSSQRGNAVPLGKAGRAWRGEGACLWCMESCRVAVLGRALWDGEHREAVRWSAALRRSHQEEGGDGGGWLEMRGRSGGGSDL